MSRNLLILLLLATGVVLTDDVRGAEPGASATKAKAQTEEGAEPGASASKAKAQTEKGAEPGASTTEAQSQSKEGAKLISGMSILGNQEAPKSLVIVPWKSSDIGASLGISTMLDDSRQPIDKEVFMRALSYFEIRSEMTP